MAMKNKLDWKEISSSEGYKKLKKTVLKDTGLSKYAHSSGTNCFNTMGCNHEFTRYIPQDDPVLLKLGLKQACISVSKCQHKYCDTFRWVIDQAKHFAHKYQDTNITVGEILTVWEKNRSYSWSNYYQKANRILLNKLIITFLEKKASEEHLSQEIVESEGSAIAIGSKVLLSKGVVPKAE